MTENTNTTTPALPLLQRVSLVLGVMIDRYADLLSSDYPASTVAAQQPVIDNAREVAAELAACIARAPDASATLRALIDSDKAGPDDPRVQYMRGLADVIDGLALQQVAAMPQPADEAPDDHDDDLEPADFGLEPLDIPNTREAMALIVRAELLELIKSGAAREAVAEIARAEALRVLTPEGMICGELVPGPAPVERMVRLSAGPWIDLADVVEISPVGGYADECTLTMGSGRQYPASKPGAADSREAAAHWAERVATAKRGGWQA